MTLTPVGLNAAARTDTFGGSRVRSTVLYPYTPGGQVSVGVHVVFLSHDSADPFVVSYPS